MPGREFIHGLLNGQRIAVKRGSDLRYIHTDHLGSTSGQTDASGNPVNGSYTRFDAYGSLRAGDPAALSTDRTFTGQKQDGTGLLYYNARYGVYPEPAEGTRPWGRSCPRTRSCRMRARSSTTTGSSIRERTR